MRQESAIRASTVSIPVGSISRAVVGDISLRPMKPDDLEKLLTSEMPFGKHLGRLIADLPGNYLNWFAREGFPAGEIGRLLALMHEIDHNGLRDILIPLRKR